MASVQSLSRKEKPMARLLLSCSAFPEMPRCPTQEANCPVPADPRSDHLRSRLRNTSIPTFPQTERRPCIISRSRL